MNSQSTTLIISSHQQWELQNLMTDLIKENDSKYERNRNPGQKMKEDIMNYMKQSKKQLDDRKRSLELIKDFFIEKDCFTKKTKNKNEIMTKDEVYDSIKKLRTLIFEKDKSSECYNAYVSFMVEFCDIDRQKWADLESSIHRGYKFMSFYQRDNINRVAQKLIMINDLEKKVKSLDEISIFFTKLMRYGISQQFPQLALLDHEQLKVKSLKLVEYLKSNFIEIQSNNYRESSVKEFIAKLSNNIYSKEQTQKKLQKMHFKTRDMFEPLFNEIYRLRENNNSKIQHDIYARRGLYSKKQQQKFQEQSINKIKSLEKKNEGLISELKDLKWFISVINNRDTSDDFATQRLIHSMMARYKDEQLGKQLMKIYESTKYKEGSEYSSKTKRKTYNHSFSSRDEKSSQEIQTLKKQIKQLKTQNQTLSQKNEESLEERIQLLDQIEQLKMDKEFADQFMEESKRKELEGCDKCKDNKNQYESLMFAHQEQKYLLESKDQELDRLRQQNTLYEKTIVELQNRNTQQLISENAYGQPLKIQNEPKKEQFEELLRQYEQIISQKDHEITSLKKQSEYIVQRMNRQKEDEVLKVRELLISQYAENEENLKAKNNFKQNQKTYNPQIQQLSSQLAELTHRHQQLIKQIRYLVQAKQKAQTQYQILVEQNKKTNQDIIYISEKIEYQMVEKQGLRKVIEQMKKQIIELSRKNEELRILKTNMEQRQSELIQQINSIRSQANTKSKSNLSTQDRISEADFKNLQNEMLELREINHLIKNEYKNYREEVNNSLKQRVEGQTKRFKEMQAKMKESNQQLYNNFIQLKERFHYLQKQNENLKQKLQKANNAYNTFQKIQQNSNTQAQLRQMTARYQQLRRDTDHQIKQRQYLLAQKHQALEQYERRMNDFDAMLMENNRLRQKLQYYEDQMQQQQQNITALKLELEQKEQEVIRIKIEMLEQQIQ